MKNLKILLFDLLYVLGMALLLLWLFPESSDIAVFIGAMVSGAYFKASTAYNILTQCAIEDTTAKEESGLAALAVDKGYRVFRNYWSEKEGYVIKIKNIHTKKLNALGERTKLLIEQLIG